MNPKSRVTVWSEPVHDLESRGDAKGMHECIAHDLRESDEFEIRTATLDESEHGLTEDVLRNTDVLVWWSHRLHEKVEDKIVDRIQARVLEGMGLVVLHSGHYSKIFKRLLGTTCSLTWRQAADKEFIWVCNPSHPICHGIGRSFEIAHEELYGEPFAIPTPDEVVFLSWFEGGEAIRSGCTWKRGAGKIFYFRPVHAAKPPYYQDEVRLIIRNGVRWAQSGDGRWMRHSPDNTKRKPTAGSIRPLALAAR